MKSIVKVLLTALVVVLLSNVLSGVSVDGYWSAIIVALVLGLLRLLVKPLLIILTLPITILTLGLFLFVINAIIVILADYLIDGFAVASFGWAIIFSILLALLQAILFSVLGEESEKSE